MSPSRSTDVETLVGLACAVGIFVIGYLTLDPTRTVSTPVLVSMLIAIAMLLGQTAELADLIYSYRGIAPGGDDPDSSDNNTVPTPPPEWWEQVEPPDSNRTDGGESDDSGDG